MTSSRSILLTAPGVSALAVVRIDGDGAEAFVEERFGKVPELGTLRHGNWTLGGEVVDDPLVVGVEGGFEIHLHGGRRIVERILADAAAAGFVNTPWKEAAGDELARWLPQAKTRTAIEWLLAQPKLRETAKIDPNDRTLERLLIPATIALVGPANAGKSTLANRLAGTTTGSLVADIAGTTRDWVGHIAILADAVPITLVDTPGRREGADAIEREALRLSRTAESAAEVIVLLLDATRPDDIPAEYADDPRVLRVWNKSDLAEPPGGDLTISAVAGSGVAELEGKLLDRLGVELGAGPRRCPFPGMV